MEHINGNTCHCPEGFTGKLCEKLLIDKDYCKSNPCKNGGICYNLVNGYRCHCSKGHIGGQCNREIKTTKSTTQGRLDLTTNLNTSDRSELTVKPAITDRPNTTVIPENGTLHVVQEHPGVTVDEIAAISVTVTIFIVVIPLILGCLLYRRYVIRNTKNMNFDNPVYRKTTCDLQEASNEKLVVTTVETPSKPYQQPHNFEPLLNEY